MKHTREVKDFSGSQQKLAEEIGDLYYDSLAEFLHMLSSKISADAEKDKGRGREKLARELHASAQHLADAATHISSAWVICEPHARQWQKQAQQGAPGDAPDGAHLS